MQKPFSPSARNTVPTRTIQVNLDVKLNKRQKEVLAWGAGITLLLILANMD